MRTSNFQSFSRSAGPEKAKCPRPLRWKPAGASGSSDPTGENRPNGRRRGPNRVTIQNERAMDMPKVRPPSRLARAHPLLCRWVPIAATLCFLAWCFVSVRSDFSWDDADPEVLNQAWRLARGESIYRGIDTPPFTFAAYPPFYFALTALLLKFTGLSFLPARLPVFPGSIVHWLGAGAPESGSGTKAGRVESGRPFSCFSFPHSCTTQPEAMFR